jgi:uncharacterized protein YciI
MPLFALIGHDGPLGLELRPTHRPAHLDHWRPLALQGRVRHGGPLLDDAGAPCGSMLLFEAPDRASACAHAAADPYVVSDIFARYEVFETRTVLPEG